jgi:hypothetical protein
MIETYEELLQLISPDEITYIHSDDFIRQYGSFEKGISAVIEKLKTGIKLADILPSRSDAGYDVLHFLAAAAKCSTPEEYGIFYKENYERCGFIKADIRSYPDDTLKLETKDSLIVSKKNTPENYVEIHRLACSGKYDTCIPSPDVIKTKDDLYIGIQKLYEDYQNDLDINFQLQQKSSEIESTNIFLHSEASPHSSAEDSIKAFAASPFTPGISIPVFNTVDTETGKETEYKGYSVRELAFYGNSALSADSGANIVYLHKPADFTGVNTPADLIKQLSEKDREYLNSQAFIDKYGSYEKGIDAVFRLFLNGGKLYELFPGHDRFPVEYHSESLRGKYKESVYGYEKDVIMMDRTDYDSIVAANREYASSLKGKKTEELEEASDRYEDLINRSRFKLRPNTAGNFWHNYCVLCRTEANNPQDALTIRESMMEHLTPDEKTKMDEVIRRYEKSGMTFTGRCISGYNLIAEENKITSFIPGTLSKQNNNPLDSGGSFIANSPYWQQEYLSGKGDRINSEIKTVIGDTVNWPVKCSSCFTKKTVISLPPEPLEIMCASRALNVVVLATKDRHSKYEIPYNEFVERTKKYEKKIEKIEQKYRDKDLKVKERITSGLVQMDLSFSGKEIENRQFIDGIQKRMEGDFAPVVEDSDAPEYYKNDNWAYTNTKAANYWQNYTVYCTLASNPKEAQDIAIYLRSCLPKDEQIKLDGIKAAYQKKNGRTLDAAMEDYFFSEASREKREKNDRFNVYFDAQKECGRLSDSSGLITEKGHRISPAGALVIGDTVDFAIKSRRCTEGATGKSFCKPQKCTIISADRSSNTVWLQNAEKCITYKLPLDQFCLNAASAARKIQRYKTKAVEQQHTYRKKSSDIYSGIEL